jgi:hypothetical protein
MERALAGNSIKGLQEIPFPVLVSIRPPSTMPRSLVRSHSAPKPSAFLPNTPRPQRIRVSMTGTGRDRFGDRTHPNTPESPSLRLYRKSQNGRNGRALQCQHAMILSLAADFDAVSSGSHQSVTFLFKYPNLTFVYVTERSNIWVDNHTNVTAAVADVTHHPANPSLIQASGTSDAGAPFGKSSCL